MIPFLIGLVALVGVWTVRRRPGAAPWFALAVGVLVVAQIAWARGRLDGYHLRILGQRFAWAEAPALEISGEPDRSDVYVGGAGLDPLAYVGRNGDSLSLERGPGRGGLVLTRRSGADPGWTVLGSVPLEDGDRIGWGSSSEWTFRVTESPGRGALHRWVRDDGEARSVPYPEGAGFLGFFPSRPDVFQRSYPLADLLVGTDSTEVALEQLASFLYYESGDPRLVVLDDHITVTTAAGVVRQPSDLALDPRSPRARILIAGLPLRDIDEPRLGRGERYGVRPIRSFAPRMDEGWLTLAETRQRVEPVPVEAMSPDAGLWLLPGQGLPQPGALQLAGYSNRFGTVSQGLLRRDPEGSRDAFRILTPSGLSDAAVGRPFTLGDGERGLLFRLDSLHPSPPFLLGLLALFGVGALAFPALRIGSAGASVALVGIGLVGLRALLSLSAWARYPFVDEGFHLSLWLIPALPWLVGGIGRALAGRSGGASVAVVPRGFSGGYMGAPASRPTAVGGVQAVRSVTVGALVLASVVVLARVLFPQSPAKTAVLAALAFLVCAAVIASETESLRAWASRWSHRIRATLDPGTTVPFPGLLTGIGLAAGRVALDALGYREQITLGGTRIGVSVFYTPLVVVLFAWVLWIHLDRVDRAERQRQAAERAARAWVDLGGFLVFALALVSAWISDFGIILTTLPGPAALMVAVGLFWRRRFGPGVALGGMLPMVLFVLLQLSPGAIRPSALQDAAQAGSTRLEEWSRNELLLLERGDPELLGLIGESRSEALAVMRETMRSYTRGNWVGKGFLLGRVSPEIRATAAREHAAGALLASQWGLLGSLGLVAALLALLAPFAGALRRGGGEVPTGARGVPRGVIPGVLILGGVGVLLPSPANTVWLVFWVGAVGALAVAPLVGGGVGAMLRKVWTMDAERHEGAHDIEIASGPGGGADPWWTLGATAAATVVGAGLYMILANYGLVLFTGKNVYLLGLDSVGDVLESLALLGLTVAGLALAHRREQRDVRSTGAATHSDAVAVVPHEPWRRVG